MTSFFASFFKKSPFHRQMSIYYIEIRTAKVIKLKYGTNFPAEDSDDLLHKSVLHVHIVLPSFSLQISTSSASKGGPHINNFSSPILGPVIDIQLSHEDVSFSVNLSGLQSLHEGGFPFS